MAFQISGFFKSNVQKFQVTSNFDKDNNGKIDMLEARVMTDMMRKSRIDMLKRAYKMYENAQAFKTVFYSNQYLSEHAPNKKSIKKFSHLIKLLQGLKKAVETKSINKEDAKQVCDALSAMVNSNIQTMGEIVQELGNAATFFCAVENGIGNLDDNHNLLELKNEGSSDNGGSGAVMSPSSGAADDKDDFEIIKSMLKKTTGRDYDVKNESAFNVTQPGVTENTHSNRLIVRRFAMGV